MTRYLVLAAFDPGGWERLTPDERQAGIDQHVAFEAAIAERGAKVAGAALAGPDTATTLRTVEGRLQVTDGPFAELAEQIGGFYLVDLPDLDAAIEACRLLPSTFTIEIRPVMIVAEPSRA